MRISKSTHAQSETRRPNLCVMVILAILTAASNTAIHSKRKSRIKAQHSKHLHDMESLLEKMESLEIVHIPGPLDIESLATAQDDSKYSYHGRHVDVSHEISKKLRAMRRSRLQSEQRKLNNAKDDLQATLTKMKKKNENKELKNWGFSKKEATGFSKKFKDIEELDNLFQNYDKALRNVVPEFMKENIVLSDLIQINTDIENRERFNLLRIQNSRTGDFLESGKYPEKAQFIKSNGKIYMKNRVTEEFQKFELEQGLEDDLNTLITTEVQKEIEETQREQDKQRRIDLEDGLRTPIHTPEYMKSKQMEFDIKNVAGDLGKSVDLENGDLEKELEALMGEGPEQVRDSDYSVNNGFKSDKETATVLREKAMTSDEKIELWNVNNFEEQEDVDGGAGNQTQADKELKERSGSHLARGLDLDQDTAWQHPKRHLRSNGFKNLIQRKISYRMLNLLRGLGFAIRNRQNSARVKQIEDRLRDSLVAFSRASHHNRITLKLFNLLYKDDNLDTLAEKAAIRAALRRGSAGLAAYLDRHHREYLIKDYLIPEHYELKFIFESHDAEINDEVVTQIDSTLLLQLHQYFTLLLVNQKREVEREVFAYLRSNMGFRKLAGKRIATRMQRRVLESDEGDFDQDLDISSDSSGLYIGEDSPVHRPDHGATEFGDAVSDTLDGTKGRGSEGDDGYKGRGSKGDAGQKDVFQGVREFFKEADANDLVKHHYVDPKSMPSSMQMMKQKNIKK